MKEVTKAEFFIAINKTDCISAPESTMNKSIFMTRRGTRIGESFYVKNEYGRNKYPIETKYFIY